MRAIERKGLGCFEFKVALQSTLQSKLLQNCAKQISFLHEFVLSNARCRLSLMYMLIQSDVIFSGRVCT